MAGIILQCKYLRLHTVKARIKLKFQWMLPKSFQINSRKKPSTLIWIVYRLQIKTLTSNYSIHSNKFSSMSPQEDLSSTSRATCSNSIKTWYFHRTKLKKFPWINPNTSSCNSSVPGCNKSHKIKEHLGSIIKPVKLATIITSQIKLIILMVIYPIK